MSDTIKASDVMQIVHKIVQMLSEKNIKVRFRGDEAIISYNKDGSIFSIDLPSLPEEIGTELFRVTNGFLDHEVAHSLLTTHSAFEFISSQAVTYNLSKRSLKSYWNCIEDGFIERELKKLYSGSAKNLRAVLKHVTDKTLSSERHLAAVARVDFEGVLSCAMPIYSRALFGDEYAMSIIEAQGLAGHYQFFREILGDELIEEVGAVSNSHEAVSVSVKICLRFKAAEESKEPEEPEESEESKEPEDSEIDREESSDDAEPQESEADDSDDTEEADDGDDAEADGDDADGDDTEEADDGDDTEEADDDDDAEADDDDDTEEADDGDDAGDDYDGADDEGDHTDGDDVDSKGESSTSSDSGADDDDDGYESDEVMNDDEGGDVSEGHSGSTSVGGSDEVDEVEEPEEPEEPYEAPSIDDFAEAVSDFISSGVLGSNGDRPYTRDEDLIELIEPHHTDLLSESVDRDIGPRISRLSRFFASRSIEGCHLFFASIS